MYNHFKIIYFSYKKYIIKIYYYFTFKKNEMTQNIILNHLEIEHKIKRISYQIVETFAEEDELILAGIANNGYAFAKKIGVILKSISD